MFDMQQVNITQTKQKTRPYKKFNNYEQRKGNFTIFSSFTIGLIIRNDSHLSNHVFHLSLVLYEKVTQEIEPVLHITKKFLSFSRDT